MAALRRQILPAAVTHPLHALLAQLALRPRNRVAG
jgi:hypothetical protein